MLSYRLSNFNLVFAAALLFAASCNYAVAPALAGRAEDFKDIKLTPDRDLSAEAQGYLRADAREIETILGVGPLVGKIEEARRGGIDTATLPKVTQNARLVCLWRILQASEEVRKVVAQIDFDIAEAHIALDKLTSKRDMTRNMINIANFYQSGILGVTRQSMALAKENPTSRQIQAMISFSTGTFLPLVNMTVPYWYTSPADRDGNMLAHVFDTRFRPADADQSYLWRFFNNPVPGAPNNLTRRQILVKHWQSFGGTNTKKPTGVRLLTGDGEEGMKETITLLGQRINLLQDMKTHIEEFDGSLFELHQAITTSPSTSLPATQGQSN